MWSIEIQNWPFYYALVGLLALSLLMTLADPADEVRHGPDRDARGRGQGGHRRHQHAGLQAARRSWPARCSSAWPARVYGYYLTFVDPIGMFNILLSVQILLSMLLGGRGTLFGPVLGAFLIEPLNEWSPTTTSAAATPGC